MAAAGDAPQQLTSTPAGHFRWSPDGSRIYFRSQARGSGLWALTLADLRERRVTQLTGRAGSVGSNGLAVDTAHLYFTWSSDLGDIWVMDVGPAGER